MSSVETKPSAKARPRHKHFYFSFWMSLVIILWSPIASSSLVNAANTNGSIHESAPNQASPATLAMPVLTASSGQVLTVNLVVTTSVPTRGFQGKITYNPAVLRCDSVTQGSFYRDWALPGGGAVIPTGNSSCNNTAGSIGAFGYSILGGADGGPVGSGIIVTIQFTAIANGVSPLTLDPLLTKIIDASPYGTKIPADLMNGEVFVGVTATPIPTHTPTPTSGSVSPSHTPTHTITSSATSTSTPTATPNPSFTMTPSSSGACCRADVNRDGVINTDDVVLVGVQWLKTGPPGWIPEDVNEDGVVNTDDVVIIGICWLQPPNCTIGSPTSSLTSTFTPTVTLTFTPTRTSITPTPSYTPTIPTLTSTSTPSPTVSPSPGPSPTPTPSPTPGPSPSPTPSPTPTQTGQPQPTGTNTPLPTKTPTASPTPVGQMKAQAPGQTISIGQSFDVEIRVENIAVPIRGAQAGILFDKAILQCVSVSEGSFFQSWVASDSGGGSTLMFPTGTCDNTAGKLTTSGISILGGSNPSGPSGSGTVFIARFTALTNGISSLDLTTDAAVFDASSKKLGVSLLPGQVTISSSTAAVTATSTFTITPSFTASQPSQASSTPQPTATATATRTRTATQGSSNATSTSFVPTAGTYRTQTPRPTLASNSRMGFNPAQKIANVGEEFTIDLVIELEKFSRGAQAGISFNPSVLECKKVEEGTLYKNWATSNNGTTLMVPGPVINNSAGTVSTTGISVMGAGQGGATGSGSLFKFTFKAKANGTATIQITNPAIFDDSPYANRYNRTLENGEVFVGNTPTPTQPGSGNSTPRPTIGSGGTLAATSQAGGTVSPTNTLDPNLTQTPGGVLTMTAYVRENPTADSTSISETPDPNTSGTPGTENLGEPEGFDLSEKVDANGILIEDVEVRFPGESVSLRIPKDVQALTADNLPVRLITIQRQSLPSNSDTYPAFVSPVYDLSPSGATFDPPIYIIFYYNPENLAPGISPAGLFVGGYEEQTGEWLTLPSLVDSDAHMVSASLSHFSRYALMAKQDTSNGWLGGIALSILLLGGLGGVFYWRWRMKVKKGIPNMDSAEVLLLPNPNQGAADDHSVSEQIAPDEQRVPGQIDPDDQQKPIVEGEFKNAEA